jgi:hypothetical protein
MQQQLITMLDLQDAMNTKVHPLWREQNYAWHRAQSYLARIRRAA